MIELRQARGVALMLGTGPGIMATFAFVELTHVLELVKATVYRPIVAGVSRGITALPLAPMPENE
jgi:hypothetical protein